MAQETATQRGTSLRDLVLIDPRELSLAHQLGLFGLLLIALVPVPLTAVQLSGLTIILYFMMFAMSWDFVSGYTGQISFGHTLFFTTGGYTSALLNLEFGISPLLGIPAGMVMAAVAGVLVGVPALRLRGPYLSLITLIVPIILLQLFVVYAETFGGQSGLAPPSPLFGSGQGAAITISGPDAFVTGTIAAYYASFLIFLLILGVMLAITRSDAGDVFTAVREDEDVVAAVGLNPSKFKIFAFVVSGAAGGLAGAMFVHTVGDPLPAQLLEIDIAIRVIIMTIIGGMGTIVGAAIGALFFVVANTLLNGIDVTIPLLGKTPGALEPLPLYFVALLVLFLLPEGIYGAAVDAINRYAGDDDPPGGDGPSAAERTVEKYTEEVKERL